MRFWPVALILFGISTLSAQTTPASGTLTVDDVVRLSKSDVSEDVIVAKVKSNGKPFDLNPDEILALKKSGVSSAVINTMMDPARPYAPPAPPAAPAVAPPAAPPVAAAAPAPPPIAAAPPAPAAPPPPPKPPSDPLALKVPPDPGVYFLAPQEMFIALALRSIDPYKQPGKMSALSGGLVKGHIVGSVPGPAAGTRISAGTSVFFFRLPERASIDDLVVVMLDKSGDHRDLDFGTKPGKPVFPVSSVKQFDSKEVMMGIYRLSVPMLKKGEYLFFLRGSGDEKKGLLGKGYELGVN